MNAKAPPVANKKTPKIMVEIFIAPYRHRRKRDRSVRLLEQSRVFSEVLGWHSQRLSIALTRRRVDRRVRSNSEVR